MDALHLFLYGLTITIITMTGAISYQKAKRKEEMQDIKNNYANWGN